MEIGCLISVLPFLRLYRFAFTFSLSLSHVYMTYGIPTPSMPVEPLRDKDIRYILWLVFKVCVSKHDIILFKFFKKLVNINFMYNVRCTNFKS